MQLQGNTVAVTGANGNLGRAVVHTLVSAGADVRLLDLAFDRDYVGSLPGNASCHEIDLLSAESARTTIGGLGRLDGLCNVAGGFAMGLATWETSDADWSHMFDLNLRTMLNAVRATVPGMLSARSGAIVNIGAAGALHGAALMGPYIASKAAVIRTTETLSAELKDQGINVNCVLPSVIDTPQNRAAMPDADYSEWVTPAQLAEAICFLLSPAASGIHGAALPVKNLA